MSDSGRPGAGLRAGSSAAAARLGDSVAGGPGLVAPAAPALRRVVSRWEVVGLAIGDVIGSGIYLLPAAAAAQLGGASVWAVLAAGLAVVLIVLCFAEAASLFDRPGSAYVYARSAFGPFIGWQVGWMSWIARVTALGTLASGFAQAVAASWPAAGSGAGRAAVITLLLGGLAALNIAGVKGAARTTAWLSAVKLVPLLAFVAAGLWLLPAERLLAAQAPSGETLRQGALLFLFSYVGFENTAAAAGEHRNPQRDVPFALLIQISVVTLLYFLVQLVAVGVWSDPAPEASLASAMEVLVGPWGASLLTAGALISILGTNANTLLAGPRYLYAIAHTGALPRWLTSVHPSFHTPHLAIGVQAGIAILLGISGSFAQLAPLSVIARLATYLSTAGAVIALRRQLPETARTVRLPFGSLLPCLAMLACLIFIGSATWIHLLAAGIALGAGALLWLVRRPGAE